MSKHIRYELHTTIELVQPFKGSHSFYVRDTGLTATEAIEMADIWLRHPRRVDDVKLSRAGGKLEMVLV